jgi:hypothetical protein
MAGVEIRSFGQAAYEAYAEHCGGKSINGDDLPAWADQRPEIRAHWEAAAEALAAGVRGDG